MERVSLSLSPLLPRSMTDCDTRHGHGSVEAARPEIVEARLWGESIAWPHSWLKTRFCQKIIFVLQWTNSFTVHETLGNDDKFQFSCWDPDHPILEGWARERPSQSWHGIISLPLHFSISFSLSRSGVSGDSEQKAKRARLRSVPIRSTIGPLLNSNSVF